MVGETAFASAGGLMMVYGSITNYWFSTPTPTPPSISGIIELAILSPAKSSGQRT